jgi:hypothetical protein
MSQVESLRDEVVHQYFAGQWAEHVLHGFDVNGMLLVSVHGLWGVKAHDQRYIEAVIHYRTLTGQNLAHGECFDFGDAFLQVFGSSNEPGAVCFVTGVLQPGEYDVLYFAGRRLRRQGAATTEQSDDKKKGERTELCFHGGNEKAIYHVKRTACNRALHSSGAC